MIARVLDDVSIIRIKSKTGNILIMEDHVSTIDRVEGTIEFETTFEKIAYNNITAYYSNSKNVFNIIIKEG